MYRRCIDCKHWQGHKNTVRFAMCNCVIATLDSRLWEMESLLPYKRFRAPFDPHDMKYFSPHPDILRKLKTMYLPPSIKREIASEDDLKLIVNNKGEIIGERVIKAKIIYFYTDEGYSCEYFERR